MAHLTLLLVILTGPSSFSPLPKSWRPERIHENADVYDFEISETDMDRIDALDKGDDGACQWNPIHAA